MAELRYKSTEPDSDFPAGHLQGGHRRERQEGGKGERGKGETKEKKERKTTIYNRLPRAGHFASTGAKPHQTLHRGVFLSPFFR